MLAKDGREPLRYFATMSDAVVMATRSKGKISPSVTPPPPKKNSSKKLGKKSKGKKKKPAKKPQQQGGG